MTIWCQIEQVDSAVGISGFAQLVAVPAELPRLIAGPDLVLDDDGFVAVGDKKIDLVGLSRACRKRECRLTSSLGLRSTLNTLKPG